MIPDGQPPDELKSARLIELYVCTWADFLLLRPKRFARRCVRRGSTFYLSPGVFAAISLTLAALAVVTISAGESQEHEPTPEQLVATFAISIAISNLILVPTGALAARILGKRYSIRRAFAGFCYATCANHFFPVFVLIWSAGPGNSENVENWPVALMLVYLALTMGYNIAAIARFNRLPLVRFAPLAVSLMIILQAGLALATTIGEDLLPSSLSVSAKTRQLKIARARTLLNELDNVSLATINTSMEDQPTLRVSSRSRYPSARAEWRTELLEATNDEEIAFDIYYHNTAWLLERPARNVRIHLTQYAGDAFTIAVATVAGENVAPVHGVATIRLRDNFTFRGLVPIGVTWYPNPTAGAMPLPYEQTITTLDSAWLQIGDVMPGWDHQGHIIASFRIAATQKSPRSLDYP